MQDHANLAACQDRLVKARKWLGRGSTSALEIIAAPADAMLSVAEQADYQAQRDVQQNKCVFQLRVSFKLDC